jgi:hypothetical protein
MKIKTYFTQRHAFHLVDPSSMPILTAFSSLTLVSGGVMYFHGYVVDLKQHCLGFSAFYLVCLYDDVTLLEKDL